MGLRLGLNLNERLRHRLKTAILSSLSIVCAITVNLRFSFKSTAFMKNELPSDLNLL